MSKDDKLTKLVNSSGFPLQIGIEHEVTQTEGKHGWRILSKEHAWDDLKGNSGFIDLILENRHQEYLLVVECKRVLNSSWIFLQPSKTVHEKRDIKAWVSYKRQGKMEKLEWIDSPGDPPTVESEFCVVPGQDARSKPMLERVASDLVLATESFALEDNSYYDRLSDYLRITVPVIVTTAELKVCHLTPEDVSISTGEISAGEFTTVPYLQFRKQMSTRRAEDFIHYKKVNYNNISYAKENTVFIVNSNNLIKFLEGFEIKEP